MKINSEINNSIASFYDNEVISLFDIWKKLVSYKKVFFMIFFITLLLGTVLVLLIPEKYSFSLQVELGSTLDENWKNTMATDTNGVITKIKKVLYPAAVEMYNLQAVKKMYVSREPLFIKKVGSGALLLSMNGSLEDSKKFEFIFQKIVDGIAFDTREYVNSRRKELEDLKAKLEHHLIGSSNLYKATVRNRLGVNAKRKVSKGKMETTKLLVAPMYRNKQEALIARVEMIQKQILGTSNPRAASDLIISDLSGRSKHVLLYLVEALSLILVAFFFAFLGVFVTDYIVRSSAEVTKT